ncbi:hypothetical protein C9I98_14290 [Photobacterium sanctipauli]|uniref:Uncharacterized protein n=1 Tax=Photobacterium sanctipauli TaxID=1342794 RepID=A0A2T3NRV5_9GAMM|nr:hypothetical protein [Photobacterium sanctipauli]PSW19014.1 hypothetical protein C9I98_14290 [Photobacterium sanctipauli]
MRAREWVVASTLLLALTACGERDQPEKAQSQDPGAEQAMPGEGEPSDMTGEDGAKAADETEGGKDTAGSSGAESPSAPAQLPAEVDIWQSPSELELGGVKLNLGSDLWLNSMPVIGDDGTSPANKLFASIKLLAQDMKPLPQGVEVLQVMIVQGDQQWLASEGLDIRAAGEMSVEVALSGGPEWVPGSKADIAVTVLFKGSEHILVEKGIVIDQVY